MVQQRQPLSSSTVFSSIASTRNVIEADGTELVDQHRSIGEGWMAQHVVEQRRLAAAEEAGDDDHRGEPRVGRHRPYARRRAARPPAGGAASSRSTRAGSSGIGRVPDQPFDGGPERGQVGRHLGRATAPPVHHVLRAGPVVGGAAVGAEHAVQQREAAGALQVPLPADRRRVAPARIGACLSPMRAVGEDAAERAHRGRGAYFFRCRLPLNGRRLMKSSAISSKVAQITPSWLAMWAMIRSSISSVCGRPEMSGWMVSV